MEKKEYIKPKSVNLAVHMKSSLLAGSGNEVGFEGGIPADAKRNFGWEEDED